MPSRRALLAALLAGLALPATARADCPDADTPAEAGTIDNVRAAVLCLVNERRVAAGVAVLRGSPYLVRCASYHSADMVRYRYLAHQAQGRPSLFSRIWATGYFKGAADALYSENIGVIPEGSSARTLVNAWMKSPTHTTNLLHPAFRDLGVGTAFSPPDPVFYPDYEAVIFTTDFGERHIRAGRPPARCRVRRAAPPQDGSAAPRRRYCRRVRSS